jgi:uncharacterized protein YdaU (DUF1376 family)
MGTLKWYKRDPRAALIGMASLSLEECGAYNKILDLIYIREGKLKDDAEEICGWLKCKPRVWKRIRARLIDLEKIYVHDGCLHNERADDEIVKVTRMIQIGTESANKRWATYNEIKGLQHGYPMQPTPRLRKSSANIVPIPKRD